MLKILRSECLKIISSRSFWVILVLAIVLQPLMGLMEIKEIVKIGLDATPATNPELTEAIGPLKYLGFDVTDLGLMPIVVWGAIMGAQEFRNHNLRTTLLSVNNRVKILAGKIGAFSFLTVLIAFFSIYLTVGITHVFLGSKGLNPILLSSATWQHLGLTVINWLLLSLISFGLGFICRTPIIPLVFMIAQMYGMTDKWTWGHYLPVAAGNDLLSVHSFNSIMILLGWLIISITLAYYSFIRLDLGGKY
ncbi:ABC transporter permease [Xylocopilactobacillus apicola]|uniref:Lantibiotic ABC transporter permease n=1 Tax=Xylocopilactobacillus apicola TaxID=2932184 RepID=A0AAU9D8M9_9LACO|nr:ABC transporter permease [Xylocopilactobacillus apicola]BDR58700.1 lantibiotic ABC transporter permease [Xylocopilactobacillus apicola]